MRPRATPCYLFRSVHIVSFIAVFGGHHNRAIICPTLTHAYSHGAREAQPTTKNNGNKERQTFFEVGDGSAAARCVTTSREELPRRAGSAEPVAISALRNHFTTAGARAVGPGRGVLRRGGAARCRFVVGRDVQSAGWIFSCLFNVRFFIVLSFGGRIYFLFSILRSCFYPFSLLPPPLVEMAESMSASGLLDFGGVGFVISRAQMRSQSERT